MPNQPKRNHLVPQLLLKYFSTEDMVLVYDKQENKHRYQHIKNTAVIKNHNRASPLDLIKISSEAMEEAKRSLKEDVLGSEYDELGRELLEAIESSEEYLRKSFFPFYKDKGIDAILSDQFGLEKILARMESEVATILRNIHDPKHNVTEEEIKSVAAYMAFIALNNPKFRKSEDIEQKPFYHPLAQMGEVISPLFEKISKYRFQLISFDLDILVTSDFPMLFIQINDGDLYVRSPYNFVLAAKEVEFLYIPIAPNKAIFGQPPSKDFIGVSKEGAKFVLSLNGLTCDFADRFVYAKNMEELAIAKKKSGISYPTS